MGREATCDAVVNGEADAGKLLLETDELIFRGGERLVIPYRDVTTVTAEQGRLTVDYPGGAAIFDLGPEAEKWADRIRNPKTVVDKLGVKPGHVVVVDGIDDDVFLDQLKKRGARLSPAAGDTADLLFYAANERSDLDRLAALKQILKPQGALWVVRPKGGGSITERDVLSEGKRAGLVDVKVVRFSSTHTAEKFVIPVKDRKP
jgi:Protein of unknown function (DUF3052)